MSENTNNNQQDTQQHTDNLAENTEAMAGSETENGRPENSESSGAEDGDATGAELKKMKAELDDVKDKHLRLIAEFDNFRRRMAKEKLEMTQTAGRELFQALLVVLDDMGRAEKQLEKSDDISAIKEGILLVFNKMRTTLQNKGLRVMEDGDGVFNPDLHEAITEIPAPTEDMAGKIIDTIEPGYYLNEKLIRHAKVVVGK